MKTIPQNMKNQRGLTLIEVLVAMTLGLVVLIGAVNMQTEHRKSFKVVEAKATMQIDAKQGFEFIDRTMRESGSMGCVSGAILMGLGEQEGEVKETSLRIAMNPGNSPTACANPETNFCPGSEIMGYDDNGGTAVVPFPFAGDVLPNTDVVSVAGGIGEIYRVASFDSGKSNLSSSLSLDMTGLSSVRLKQNHYAEVSTCSEAEIFKITSSDAAIQAGTIEHGSGGTNGNTTGKFEIEITPSKSNNPELRRVAVTTFYIANDPATGVPTLYSNIDGVSSQLVEGVETMQITYGVDTDETTWNVPDIYVNAANMPDSDGDGNPDWNKVIAMRISFIMRSREEVYDTAEQPSFDMGMGDADPVTFMPVAADKYSRLMYTNTISLRNRIVGQRTYNGKI